MNELNSKTPLRQVLPIFFGYGVIACIGMHFHELWLDESQHFLIGRDSDSLSALYWNMRYDGHPRLWNILVYFVTHTITTSYIGMQVMHLLISSAMVFVFLRYAPFSLGMKILILSGYYFLFEYMVLSRNYALGIALLFAVCVLLRRPRTPGNLGWIGLLLFVMCNTHLFFAFAAMGVYFFLLLEYGKKEWFKRPFLLFTLLFIAGYVCIIIQSQTPAEESFFHVHPGEWFSGKNLSFAAFGVIRGWLPLPQVRGGHFWDSYWLNSQHINGVLCGGLFVFFLVFPALLLQRNWKALAFYYVSLFWMVAFLVVTQLTGKRYFGMVYIFFLAACWMAGGISFPVRPALRRLLSAALYTILFIQVGIGLIALQQDITRPFSSSKETVDWLKAKGLDSERIIIDGYNGGPMISAYLGRKLYCPTTRSEGSYVIWKSSYWPRPRPTITQEITGSPYLQGLDHYLLVSNHPLDTGRVDVGLKWFQIDNLKNFTGSIEGEDYHVYQVNERLKE